MILSHLILTLVKRKEPEGQTNSDAFIFWTLRVKYFLASWIADWQIFFLKNDYTDTSVEKGGLPGMPGCMEHIGVVSQLLKDANGWHSRLMTGP